MILPLIICILIFAAGVELESSNLQIIGFVMYATKLIALVEKSKAWQMQKKKKLSKS